MTDAALSEVIQRRARELAEDAPPLTPEQRQTIAAILAGYAPAQAVAAADRTPQPEMLGPVRSV
jgi:hypothetical protein